MPAKEKTKFLPDSMTVRLKNLARRCIGAVIAAIGIIFIVALVRYNPYLTGVGAVGTFGRQTLLGEILSAIIFGIGFIPALFLFLYITRTGAMLLFGYTDNAPEYNALRTFLTMILGAAGLGFILPNLALGGMVGVIVRHDLMSVVPGVVAFGIGILFTIAFLLFAGMLLHIKWSHVRAIANAVARTLQWVGGVLHLTGKRLEIRDDRLNNTDKKKNIKDKKIVKVSKSPGQKKIAPIATMPNPESESEPEYILPPAELVERATFSKHAITPELRRTAQMLEEHFQDYGVYGKVMGIEPGPIVTLYKFEPDAGMRIAKIADTVKDMTRAMATENIRIAHIPRSNFIGVEMVNLAGRQIVRFRGLIESPEFTESKLHIPLALGVNIGGDGMYFDLAKMPHVLIAGRTGSGKSVFVQSIIMSILYHFKPDECKLIIVDPKGVDFTVWRDIPHLLTPIVTDANSAVNVLKWAVREMEDRYSKLKEIGAQNIEDYNGIIETMLKSGKKIKKTAAVGTDNETGALLYETTEHDPENMPYLVIIIDEVADLMSVARKEVEACVQRLAQKARAAGIHLVMATQRPDTSVITGVIKANFPTRISFQARSNIDSMTTLGEKGAEQLLANGDMLFSEAGRVPVRIHSAWIENKEMTRVAKFIRDQAAPEYVDGVIDSDDDTEIGGVGAAPIPGIPMSKSAKDGDLYRQAVDYVVHDKKPTISYIQRRLGIGYNKAATFIERMEAEGIVSGPDANNKRHIL